MSWKLESPLRNCQKKQLMKWIRLPDTQEQEVSARDEHPSRIPSVCTSSFSTGAADSYARAGNGLQEQIGWGFERQKPSAKSPSVKLDLTQREGRVVWGNSSSHEMCRLRGYGTLNLYSRLMAVDSVANNTAYHSPSLLSVDWWTWRINSSPGLVRPGMLSCERKRDWFLP